MELQGKIAVVTGAASGIGRALALKIAAQGAHGIVCADLNGEGAQEVAALCGGVAYQLDVSVEAEIAALVTYVEAEVGPIDLFCSNAGIMVKGGVETADADWQANMRLWAWPNG